MCEKCYKGSERKTTSIISVKNIYIYPMMFFPCIFCDEYSCGGCKSYTYVQENIHACSTCYEHDIIINFIKIEQDDINNYWIINHLNIIMLDFVRDLKIPTAIKYENTEERVEYMLDIIELFVSVDKRVDNICNWLIFADIYEVPYASSFTTLVVNSGRKNNGQVASLLR
jgi:hypothetical protein